MLPVKHMLPGDRRVWLGAHSLPHAQLAAVAESVSCRRKRASIASCVGSGMFCCSNLQYTINSVFYVLLYLFCIQQLFPIVIFNDVQQYSRHRRASTTGGDRERDIPGNKRREGHRAASSCCRQSETTGRWCIYTAVHQVPYTRMHVYVHSSRTAQQRHTEVKSEQRLRLPHAPHINACV